MPGFIVVADVCSIALDEIYRWLVDRGFSLVTFYRFTYEKGWAGRTDALFALCKSERRDG